VLSQIVAENGGGIVGLKGLYRGIRAKILQTVLNAALMFTMRDRMLSYAIALTALWVRLTSLKVDSA
jgi:hypothetical protein